jgi:hypothetical protein
MIKRDTFSTEEQNDALQIKEGTLYFDIRLYSPTNFESREVKLQ